MLSAGEWSLNQQNLITFVMVDGTGLEVPGLGAAFNLAISKVGGLFVPGAGVKGEIGNGWYKYLSTAAEADTAGPVAIVASGAGTIQQNLEYVVFSRAMFGVEFTYDVINSVSLLPLKDVIVRISTDNLGANVVWIGTTDAFGIARDEGGALPWLDPGTYYFWRSKTGFAFADPDTEVVS